MMGFVSVRCKVFTDGTGAYAEIPIVLTPSGPLGPLAEYFVARRYDRSIAWMRKVSQAVIRMLAYHVANPSCFNSSSALLRTFAQRLHSGTIGDDGCDVSGLYWRPMRIDCANKLLSALVGFSDWLVEQKGAGPLCAWAKPTRFEEMLLQAAWEHRRSRAFLGHIWPARPDNENGLRRQVAVRMRTPKLADDEDAIAFPEERFSDLLVHGFARRGLAQHPHPAMRHHLRDCLITLLMHGAGFRASECFHLWVHDVQPDSRDRTVAQVRIHHPSEGAAPDDWCDERGNPIHCNRSTYLVGRYGRRPRNELLGNAAAGWKDPALDGRYFMQAFWFPTDFGRVFLQLRNLYLTQLVQFERSHPYAWIVLEGPTAGGSYALENFKQAHGRAVRRIGLTVGKLCGTTLHAHRHAYGRRLMRAGIDPLLRKKALHHKSLSSQAVYTAPSMREAMQALDAALTSLNQTGQAKPQPNLDLQQLLAYGFADVDPDGLLSGLAPKLAVKRPWHAG